jgi:hypothetical protein
VPVFYKWGGGRADFYFYFYFWFPPLGDKTKSIVTQTKKKLGGPTLSIFGLLFGLKLLITRGVSHHSLAIYILKWYLTVKKQLWKLKYFTIQKYNLPKKIL